MANDLSAAVPQLLAQALLALRNDAIIPLLINRDFDTVAAEQGDTIDVTVPSALAANAVTPGPTPPATQDHTPVKVSIPLSFWWEVPFHLSDKEMMQVLNGHIPQVASEAIGKLADKIVATLYGEYLGVYGYAGDESRNPFGGSTDSADAAKARRILNQQLAPKRLRSAILDPIAEESALQIRAFQDASFGGGAEAILEGQIGRKLGFSWFSDQLVPTHTAGTITDGTIHGGDLDGVQTIGLKTMNMASTSLVGTVLKGDIFSVAGDPQTYVVTNGPLTAAANALVGIQFEPGAKVAWADNDLITIKDSHVVNLAFHRDAFALAMRPMASSRVPGAIQNMSVQRDRVTGLPIRLELSREHKRDRWSFDALWGVKLIRPELATRIGGLPA